MELGNFSVSLAVKDIQASKLFYEKLGFTAFAGDQSQNWRLWRMATTILGRFKAMFEKTFSPSTRAGRAMPSHSKDSQTFASCGASEEIVASA